MGPIVLVVDDETGIADNLAVFLEDEGMQVHVAHSGEDAVRRIGEGLPVQVCIMDLRLPGMNGAETIQAIRRIVPDARFIVHTGSARETVMLDLRRYGLQDLPVFKKPVEDMAALARAIADACDPARQTAP